MDAGSPRGDVAALIERSRAGDGDAARALFEHLHGELRALAASVFRSQRAGHTLQPTALVHEAFVKMMGARGAPSPWQDEAHFFAVAATAMRQILTDHARRKKADKRGGEGWQRIGIENAADAEQPGGDIDVLALDEALTKLASLDATGRRHRVVELRFFGGLSMEEIADTLGVSKSTIEGDWRAARAWLAAEMSKGA